tara:strand:- start:7651 stop:8184 length:534 start_codon:yes stop_codon:yes gene_type:complete
MPTQDFNLYTKNGYAGDLVDSGPRVVQTGILTDATLGFGKAMSRDASVANPRGVKGGTADTADVKVFAISQREYNHEASTRPSDGSTSYLQTESVSIIRQGYLYIRLVGSTAVTDLSVPLNVVTTASSGITPGSDGKDIVLGDFTAVSAGTGIKATSNVYPDELGGEGDVIKVRIDI